MLEQQARESAHHGFSNSWSWSRGEASALSQFSGQSRAALTCLAGKEASPGTGGLMRHRVVPPGAFLATGASMSQAAAAALGPHLRRPVLRSCGGWGGGARRRGEEQPWEAFLTVATEDVGRSPPVTTGAWGDRLAWPSSGVSKGSSFWTCGYFLAAESSPPSPQPPSGSQAPALGFQLRPLSGWWAWHGTMWWRGRRVPL